MPESMRTFVETKVSLAGYGSISEYFRELIRRDQRIEIDRRNTLIHQRSQAAPAQYPQRNAGQERPLFGSAARHNGRRPK
jgi:Arc/MetJ-type ribon-helix-helix transcriptional regulator